MSYDLYLLKQDDIGDYATGAFERLEEGEREGHKLTPGESKRFAASSLIFGKCRC
jgi:hypothetical protein